ncbi:MAG TPA: helix-turn-helix transcriptional regulator [Actinophytocola sp.]|nr:helix-turn-helix transcriptional regulator [Actinophytocola sp.]
MALQRAIGTAGLNQSDLAERLAWSPSKVSRMISGKRCVSPEDVSAVLALGGVVGPKRQELLELARRASERGWWQDFGDRLPVELPTLDDHEASALAVTCFETTVVPGLLQSPGYAKALLEATPAVPEVEVVDRVVARGRRGRIFDRRSPARFRFFIDEAAISRTGPGREIMYEQVRHLLRMAARPCIEIRVVPDAVGFHAGRHPFQLMEFTENNPVLHLENLTSVLFLERKDTIDSYRRDIAALGKIALDVHRSRSWLATVATRLGKKRRAHRPAGIFELEEELPE